MNINFPLKLEPSVIENYQAKGFILTPNVLKRAEINEYGAAVDAEVARRNQEDTRNVSEKSTYEQSFIQCMRLWETSAAVRALSCSPLLGGMAAQLMGVERVQLWQDQALYKEAGGRKTDAHQDQPFWPIGDVPLISAWIPFDDVTIKDGAMAYVPGSHKAGRLKIVDITHNSTPYEILDDPALNGESPVSVDVDAGSIVWHSGYTVHQASANISGNTRRVFTVVFFADGYKRSKPWPVFPLDRAGVAVGDIMQGEGMPLVWPPSAKLPEPPELLGQTTGPQHTV